MSELNNLSVLTSLSNSLTLLKWNNSTWQICISLIPDWIVLNFVFHKREHINFSSKSSYFAVLNLFFRLLLPPFKMFVNFLLYLLSIPCYILVFHCRYLLSPKKRWTNHDGVILSVVGKAFRLWPSDFNTFTRTPWNSNTKTFQV